MTTKDGVRSFGHAGGFEGAKAMLGIYPDSGFTYVMLSNLSEKADNVPPELSSFIEKLFNERFRAK
ncbi:MAG: hypothetical protein IPG59_19295 [Candidatus Melainabacteria bacterium]|nr:MAG: hypothetical protein IPG59_19295 [Candidatus Melainabacteria bacterium]